VCAVIDSATRARPTTFDTTYIEDACPRPHDGGQVVVSTMSDNGLVDHRRHYNAATIVDRDLAQPVDTSESRHDVVNPASIL
jgi:hypothetical protein